MTDEGTDIPREREEKVPQPPFYGARPLVNISADEVFGYLNEDMLFDLAWGAKLKNEAEKKRLIEEEYRPLLGELKEEALRKGWLDLKAVYGYFKCRKARKEVEILDEKGEVLERFFFPRSDDPKKLSLMDYLKDEDLMAFQAVTVGDRIDGAIHALNENEEETRAYFLHGFSVYLAEALAAYVHDLIRRELGLEKGQGKRYSPGYPLWRNLRDQEKLFRILEIERFIGVKLTEDYMMQPEQSTTAVIIYNDKAEY
jgi:5-methyltetrahydrofolate--homocysteine methyltransferase